MSVPAQALQTNIAAATANAEQRQSALDAERQQSGQAREAEIAPMEAGVTKQIGEVGQMQAPPKADLPTYQPKPLVDPKEYQQVSLGLVALAMVAGIASRGNWMGVSSSLNGALRGYLEGNQARAQKEYQDYKTKFDEAKSKSEAEQKEFADILQSKRLSINDMLTQVKITAAKYGRDDIRMEAEQKSIDGIWKRVETMDETIYKNAEQNLRLQESINSRMAMAKEKDAGAAPGQLPAGFKQEDIDYYARRVLSGDSTWKTGLSRTKSGTEIIRAVDARVPELSRESGHTPEADAVIMDERHALSHALTDRQKYVAASTQFVSNFNKQADLVEKYLEPGVGGGPPALNRWIQAGRTALAGDPDVGRLDVAIRGLAREHQRIVTGVTSNGQLQVAAQQTADALLNRDDTAESIRARLGVMREEANNALTSGRGEVKSLTDQLEHIRGGESGDASPEASAPSAPKPFADPAKERRYQEWKRAHPNLGN